VDSVLRDAVTPTDGWGILLFSSDDDPRWVMENDGKIARYETKKDAMGVLGILRGFSDSKEVRYGVAPFDPFEGLETR